MYHRKTIALLCRIPAALLLAVAVACLALAAPATAQTIEHPSQPVTQTFEHAHTPVANSREKRSSKTRRRTKPRRPASPLGGIAERFPTETIGSP